LPTDELDVVHSLRATTEALGLETDYIVPTDADLARITLELLVQRRMKLLHNVISCAACERVGILAFIHVLSEAPSTKLEGVAIVK
jgi:hypothetical protein